MTALGARVTVVGREYTITPAGNLGRRHRRELIAAKARYEQRARDEDLRTMVDLYLQELSRTIVASLAHDELVRIVTACDRETLRDVQRDVAAATAAATTERDRRLMAQASADVAGVAAKMEAQRGRG